MGVRVPRPLPAIMPFDQQYFNHVRVILNSGNVRQDPTGKDMRSIFVVNIRVDLRNNAFPLLTTRRVPFRGVVDELLWTISGCTNTNAKGDGTWDEDSERGFLGDTGAVCGFQWRHCGADYVGCDADYTGRGFDQLQEVINKIKTDPMNDNIMLTTLIPEGG